MSKNINLAKSDISSLFEQLESVSREAKQEEKKRRDYVESSVSDISSLFENLEEASKEAKVEIEIKKSLSKEDQTKLSEFSGLMDSIETIVEEKIEEPPQEETLEEIVEIDPQKDLIYQIWRVRHNLVFSFLLVLLHEKHFQVVQKDY